MPANHDEDLKAVFALRDNPFNPVYEFSDADDDTVYSNLVQSPLMVHKAPALDKLYVETAGAFEKHMTEYTEWLKARGYRLGPPPLRGRDHHIALIAGDRGTGKTTLASKMIELTRSIQPANKSSWHVFDSFEGQETDTLTEFRAGIDKLAKEIEAKSGKWDHCCVLVDNVIEGALGDALRIYDQFHKIRFVFLFLTTSDLTLIRDANLNSSKPIARYPMQALRPAEAVAFVERRIDAFRDPRLALLTNELRLYPYNEDNIRLAVEAVGGAQDAGARATQGPITLRVFNRYLDQHLRQRLRDVRKDPAYRIDNQPRAALANAHIDLRNTGTLS